MIVSTDTDSTWCTFSCASPDKVLARGQWGANRARFVKREVSNYEFGIFGTQDIHTSTTT